MIRLEVDVALNCRPNKRERRTKDGRLLQCRMYSGATLSECLKEARKVLKAGEKIGPGYAEVIEVRAYDKEAFLADPFNCKPLYEARTLN